jgi:antitoxin ParD1/3/4
MTTGTRQLNVSITPHFSKLIHNKVRSSRYANASEVVREALRRLEQEDLLVEQTAINDPDDVLVQIRKGMESVNRGDYIEINGDKELRGFFADVIARGTQRIGAKRRVARR